MAINTNPKMYSGGAVVFNTQPNVNVYAQLLAKRQAKIDALDEYDKQRINHINPTGVRDNDREGFDQRVAQIQQFYQGNKDKIRKGGTPESYAYEKMFRDVGSYVNQSKERTAKQDAAMKLYQDRLKQDGRVPDDFISELHENDSPIDAITGIDPVTGKPRKTQSLDLTKWLSQPKPFNQQTYLKSFSDIKRTAGTPTYLPVQGNPLKLTETIDETFDNGAKAVIAARAADKYQNSFSFAEQVKAEVADPIVRKKLADTFKQEFGTDPIQPEDYATAFTMELLQPKISKSKAVDNKEAIMKQQQTNALERQRIGHQNSLENIRIAAGLRGNDPETINRNVDGIIATHIANSKGLDGEVPMSAGTFKALTGADLTRNTVVKVDDGGNYTYYKKDANGNIDLTTKKEIPYQEAKTALTKGYKSGLSGAYTTTSKQPPKVNPNKAYIYNGKTIGYDKIEKAAQQSGVSVEEYIKQTGIKQK